MRYRPQHRSGPERSAARSRPLLLPLFPSRTLRACQPPPRRREPSVLQAQLSAAGSDQLGAGLSAEVDRRQLPYLGGPFGDSRPRQIVFQDLNHVLTHRQALVIGAAPEPLAERDWYAANLKIGLSWCHPQILACVM